MKLCLLLFLCGLVCLEQGFGATTSSAHNVSSGSTDNVVGFLYLKVETAEPWSLSVGDSVQIRCLPWIFDSDKNRVKDLKIRLMQIEEGSIQNLTTDSSSTGINYTLGPVSLRHRGLYRCEGDITPPHISVDADHRLIWVNDPSPAVSLELLRVDRVKYFYDKTLTIGCRLPNDQSEWRILSTKELSGSITQCPNQERSGDLLTCSIPSLLTATTGFKQHDPYWCESSTQHKSNIFNVSTAELSERRSRGRLGVKFELASPWFVREGDSVTFLCKIKYDKRNSSETFDLQLIWTQQDPGNNMKVILSQEATKMINYTLTNITHEHSGVYSCWDDGRLHMDVAAKHHFIWVEDDSPPVTIDVLSHNRTQFIDNEKMTVGCQLPNGQNQWKLKKFDYWTGTIKECEKSELSSSGLLSCTMNMGYPWDDYLFWCESTTGLKSNVLNVTNTISFDVLEAPPLPVTEGDDFTLRCLLKDKKTGKFNPGAAYFFHKEQYLGWSGDGIFTVRNVTKANEGLYNCRLETHTLTHESYVKVKARPQEKTE